jgi:hypothetical protein
LSTSLNAIALMSDTPWYTVGSSSIHNQGIFAARDIPKGTRIIEYVGERITKAESNRRGIEWMEKANRSGDGAVYLVILNKRYDMDGNVPWNTARLINHSCDPNCEAEIVRGRIWIVATKFIPAGTEITFNYGFDLECWEDHPCRCGSERCIGYIVAEEYWPKLRRILRERERTIEKAKAEDAARARNSRKGGSGRTTKSAGKRKAAKSPQGSGRGAGSQTGKSRRGVRKAG